MKAQLLIKFGGPEGFELLEIDTPDPEPNEVLIRIHAACVNAADTKICAQGPAHAPVLPAVLGLDMAGTITAAGSAVSDFSESDDVFGCCGGVLLHKAGREIHSVNPA